MPDVVFSTKCFYDRITTSDERREVLRDFAALA